MIAPSFGDIFAGNAINNGLLVAQVSEAEAEELLAAAAPVKVDLENRQITCGNRVHSFEIDPVRREKLLNGWDDIALTQSRADDIRAFEARDGKARPWLVPQYPA